MRSLLFAGVVLSLTSHASAAETISYVYDAQGRLVQVSHTGTVNDGVNRTYSYDNADNRTNVTTTGAPS